MAATTQSVKDLAPELADVEDARIQVFLDYALLTINANIWGAKADFGQTLLAAHLLTMSNRGGSGGAVTSEKVGDLSRSYGNPDMDGTTYSATSYGQMFMQLLKTLDTTPLCL